MNSYVLFLCGGKWQLPWLTYLKNKGHHIILVDPYETAPCVPFADIFFKCDVKDTEAILGFVTSNNYTIELVTSEQTDVSTLPVAIISEKLKLKSNPVKVIQRFSNKYVSRQFIKENFDRHYPDFCAAHSYNDILSFLKKYKKVIVKPSDAQSSRGVSVLTKQDSLYNVQQAFDLAKSFSIQSYVLAEEFVDGKEITLEGFCSGNTHITLTGSDKKHFRTGIASDLSYPLQLNPVLFNELITFHNSLVEKTGLEFGITHSEYIISDDEKNFWLVEMACRGGGSLIPSHIVPWASGIDCYDLLYKILFGDFKKLDLGTIDFSNQRKALLHFFEFKPGKVKSIDGLTACKALKGVLDMDLEFSDGDVLLPASDDRSRQGYCIILGRNTTEVNEILKKINNLLVITYELDFNNTLTAILPSTSMMKGLVHNDIRFNLAMGAPDIPPPREVYDIIEKYAHNPDFRYLPSKGTGKALMNLKHLVLNDAEFIDPAKNCVLVPGAKYGIYLSLKTVCNPKDPVLLFEPYWLSYPEICKSLDLNFQTIAPDPVSGRYALDQLKSMILDHNIRAIVLNNPVNPSGYIFTEAELSEIIDFCKARNTWVILDEVYKNLCFDRNLKLHHNLVAENVVRVGSLSKSLNLPGFRAGYVVGDAAFIDLFDRLHQHIATCIHPLTNEIISQMPAVAFHTFSNHCAEVYSGRFEMAKVILNKNGFKILESEASFYLMVDVTNKFANGNEAGDYYEKIGIRLTPGENYGKCYRNFIRLCLTLPDEELAIVLNQL